jgi:hypothetical protein
VAEEDPLRAAVSKGCSDIARSSNAENAASEGWDVKKSAMVIGVLFRALEETSEFIGPDPKR